MFSEHFKDQICIVTGANSGIGFGLSEELLNRGAIVYMLGRNSQKVETAAQKLSIYQDRVHTLIADVSVQSQVQKAIEKTVSEQGRLDFLFNNAGVGGTTPFTLATLEDWKKIIDINLWSVIYGVDIAVPLMLKQGSGHIINTSSIAGITPIPFQALYCLTKYAVTGLTESLKYEFADKGIRFSTVCPAAVVSEIWNKGIAGKSEGGASIPKDAYPTNKAASDILDAVEENKGIIVVPKENNESLWKNYVLGEDDWLTELARERREDYKKILESMNLDPADYEEKKELL